MLYLPKAAIIVLLSDLVRSAKSFGCSSSFSYTVLKFSAVCIIVFRVYLSPPQIVPTIFFLILFTFFMMLMSTLNHAGKPYSTMYRIRDLYR